MKEQKILSFADRRLRLQKVSDMLAEVASSGDFVPIYSRMNPRATHRLNSFLFGDSRRIARAIIFGPWLYIHAPQVKLPRGVIALTLEERKKRHLGLLTAKVPLMNGNSIQIIKKVLEAIKQADVP